MNIFLSKEDMLLHVIDQLSTIWIVRKHPKMPYKQGGHTEAFTIHKIYHNFKSAKQESDERNKRSQYLFTVKRIELRKKR